MSEQYVLSRELAWATRSILRSPWWSCGRGSPSFDAEWAFYLLAVATAGLALWIAWRLSAAFSMGRNASSGSPCSRCAVLHFHALKFNQNSVLMPLWGRPRCGSCARSRPGECSMRRSLASVPRHACTANTGRSSSCSARHRRAPRPQARGLFPLRRALGDDRGWALALAPHAAWLVANDFVPFSYAVAGHGSTSLVSALRGALATLPAASPMSRFRSSRFVAARPSRPVLQDMAWPHRPNGGSRRSRSGRRCCCHQSSQFSPGSG